MTRAVRRGAAPAAAGMQFPEPQSLLDKDGYPSMLSLRRIQRFSLVAYPLPAFLALVRANWWMDCGWEHRGKTLWMSTGGWSGNEDVIDAMDRNLLFWPLSFDTHWTGGHFKFKLARYFGEKPYPPFKVPR